MSTVLIKHSINLLMRLRFNILKPNQLILDLVVHVTGEKIVLSFFFYLWLKEYESVGTVSSPTHSLIDDFSCIFTGSRFPWSSYCIFLLLFDVIFILPVT